ncbi:CBS domain-containing protein [Amycolatopsis cihanbeyliensis]|uniref:CBS domain protein n=1 Tax=Amycolatopsis cihanbeyliensis TaxID=1128664 RepID=A0A542DMQ3_AMYCI|nr:CBS domain-containing protein [Amycolatopsis cihanbeyliensis]TQJ04254.1 CBS domain protein [Amycolatopsis cihanbeyliensis]
MTKARDIMTPDAQCMRTSDTVLDAARRMADLDVGALPICGEDDQLKGVVTDRDIVTKVLAGGKDPRAMHVGELAQGEAVTVGADDEVGEVLRTMSEHQVRRLPVIDGHDLVGMIAQADIARVLDQTRVGDVVEDLSVPG